MDSHSEVLGEVREHAQSSYKLSVNSGDTSVTSVVTFDECQRLYSVLPRVSDAEILLSVLCLKSFSSSS